MKKIKMKTRKIIDFFKKKNFYLCFKKVYLFFFKNKYIGILNWEVRYFLKSNREFYYEKCLCGHNIYKTYINFGKHKIIKCLNCNLLRNYPAPKNGVYENHLAEVYENNSQISLQVKKMFELFLDFVNFDSNILDFGSGDGRNMCLLKSLGFNNVYGLEVSNYFLEKNKIKNLNIFSCFEDIPEFLNFDLIFANHVFEHISNLEEILNSIKNKLKKNGLLVVAVPNIDSVLMHNSYRDFIWDSHY